MFKLNRGFVTGVMLGFGAGFVCRDVATHLGPTLKPLAKEAMKAGLSILNKIREQAGYFHETVSDIAAEAKADVLAAKFSAKSSELPKEARTG